MPTVYLAHDLKHDRKVALKVLRPELAAVIGAERFVVGIKTTAALQLVHDAHGPVAAGETMRPAVSRERRDWPPCRRPFGAESPASSASSNNNRP
jgi:hypothetical protein